MRDYGKVSPQFWVGNTGRKLRGNVEAQIVALYLMTSPHANMIGVFYCPVDYIAKETGLTLEGASKGLRSLIEADFCTYEEASEYIFVHQFAANQVGEELKPADKRVQGVINELAKVPKGQCHQAFTARYAAPYNLPVQAPKAKPHRSPSKAPSKPESGAGAEAEPIGGRFEEFWAAWPKSERKQDKKVCREKWERSALDAVADAILADIAGKRGTRKWTDEGGKFIEAPEVYLNNRRWEDGTDGAALDQPPLLAGAL